MQILESTGLGLRSARLVLRSRDSSVAVTLFPMIHLGEESFYDAVYRDAFSHDAVLVEGVQSPITTRVTRSYRWIAGRRLGLIVQPKYPKQAVSHARIIHADLTADEFKQHWDKVQRHIKLLLYAGAPLYGLYNRWFGTRASLAKGHTLDDLPSRDEKLGWTPEFAALDHAVMIARDQKLISVMNRYISEATSDPSRLAIVYGARHMRAVIRELTSHRFHVVDSEWMTVFPLDRLDATVADEQVRTLA